MKSLVLTLLFHLTLIQLLSATCGNIIYVRADSTGVAGDGSSWSSAYLDLQDALDEAEDCVAIQEIWVAGGVYKPTVAINGSPTSETRNLLFNIDFEVKLYGGFCGWESNRDERVKYLCPATLSGDILGDDVVVQDVDDADFPYANGADNSYNVMRMKNLSGISVLDGFTLSGGNAFHSSTLSKRIGGAIFNDGRGANNTSNPVISDCIFQYNKSIEGGGAIYNYGVDGDASPTISSCEFRYNQTNNNGGALYNYGSGSLGKSNPVVTSCLFERNVAFFGGGMYNEYEDGGVAIPVLSYSTFVHNESLSGAGLFINNVSDDFANEFTFQGCIFYYNVSQDGLIETSFVGNNVTLIPRYSMFRGAFTDQIDFNTSAFPQFVDDDANYRLLPNSLARDAGEKDPLSVSSISARDLDGNSRRLGQISDMGAYEFLTCTVNGKIYVDAASSTFRNGKKASSALSSLNMAFAMACNCSGVTTIEIAGGRYVPHRLPDLTVSEDPSNHSLEMFCPMILKGHDGVVITGDVLDNDSSLPAMNPSRDDNCNVLIFASSMSLVSIDSIEFNAANRVALSIGSSADDRDVTITNCRFAKNAQDALRISAELTRDINNDIQIESCTFENNFTDNNLTDGCIYIDSGDYTELSIADCEFVDNNMGGMYIRLADSSRSIINRCYFNNNISYIGSGIEITERAGETAFHKITNCAFVDNTAEQGGAAIFARKTYDTHYDISNCTFFRNYTDVNQSGAINFFRENGSAVIKDCIFWQNTNRQGLWGVSGDVDMSYSLVETDMCPTTAAAPVRCGEVMLYNVDPQFRSEGGTNGSDLYLMEDSPAINRGSKRVDPTGAITYDVAGSLRYQANRIDLGAYENQPNFLTECPDILTNPVSAPETNLDLSMIADSLITLSQTYITPSTGALFLDASETMISSSLEIQAGAVMEVHIEGCDN